MAGTERGDASRARGRARVVLLAVVLAGLSVAVFSVVSRDPDGLRDPEIRQLVRTRRHRRGR